MLSLVAIALAGGLVAGLLARGRVSNLRFVQFRWTAILGAGLVIGLLPLALSVGDTVRSALLLGSMIGVLLFLAANFGPSAPGVRIGLAILTLGWLLNFVVIATNGGMPLSLRALERSGQDTTDVRAGEGGYFKIEIAGPETRLRPLGDVIPVRAVRQVVSVGDIALVIGVGWTIAAGMRRPPGR